MPPVSAAIAAVCAGAPARNGSVRIPRIETPMVIRKRPRIPEKVIQSQIVVLLRTCGAAVYVLGGARPRGDYPGTRQTYLSMSTCVSVALAPCLREGTSFRIRVATSFNNGPM